MDIAVIFDIVTGLASLLIVLLGVWVRKLTDTIGGLQATVARLLEQNEREHKDVEKGLGHLSNELTTEVRNIVQQHADHDKEMAVQGERLKLLVEKYITGGRNG